MRVKLRVVKLQNGRGKILIIIIYIFLSDSVEKGAGRGGENLIKTI